MRFGYFTMPMHPLHRSWTETLQEDREIVMLADKLGFHDAFIGEHLTDANENITNSLLFLATLIHSTTNIKLATGTTNLSQSHPVMVATHSAMFDHMAKGRFILGVSPGNLRTDAEAIGNLDEDRNKLFEEVIDVLLEIWTRDPPYNIDLPNNRFKVSTMKTARLEIGLGGLAKPYQKPYPEIVGTVVAPFSKGVIAMGKRDFHPLSANFLLPKWVKTHWANYAQGKAEVGKTRRRQRLAGRAHDLRVRGRQGRRALCTPRREQPVSVLFQAAAGEIPGERTACAVQGPHGPARRRDHRRLRDGPPGLVRRRSTRSSITSSNSAKRSATSANWSIAASTGPIRRCRGARWSCWRTR